MKTDMRLIDANALLTVPNVRTVAEYDETGDFITYRAVPVESIEKAPTVLYAQRWTSTMGAGTVLLSEVDCILLEGPAMTPEPIKARALRYLYKKLKHARIALGKAEHKGHAAEEIASLQNKIEVLEWLSEIAIQKD